MIVRKARATDLPQIAALQIDSWRRAYAGMLPADFLGAPVADMLTERWAAMPGPAWLVLTGWQDDRLAGFIAVDRAAAGGAYVDNLHVARDAQRRGVGRTLMARAAALLADGGHARMWLTVIDANADARAVYARLGGREGPARQETLYGQSVTTHPVVWDDLPALAARAERGAKSARIPPDRA